MRSASECLKLAAEMTAHSISVRDWSISQRYCHLAADWRRMAVLREAEDRLAAAIPPAG